MLSYNRVQVVPEELSGCESLERLELAMNRELDHLPDQVRTRGRMRVDLGVNALKR